LSHLCLGLANGLFRLSSTIPQDGEDVNYISTVQSERLLLPGEICQVIDLASFSCWPLGLNPAKAAAFFLVKKSTARLPSEGK
jgi:hypothetical protein